MYKTQVNLEIGRGDSIEELLSAGVIEPRTFFCANGDELEGYAVIGGTAVEATITEAPSGRQQIEFAGLLGWKNAFGFGHGQRPIYKQYPSGCSLVPEVFIGTVDRKGHVQALTH